MSVARSAVSPGDAVNVTVAGIPGQNYAVVGSAVNSGLVYAGTALSVGADAQIFRIGVFDGSGQAVVSVTPPFRGTTLDRYYLQAATSASASFSPIAVSNGAVLRNADVAPGGRAEESNFDGPFAVPGAGSGTCVATPLSVSLTVPSAGKVAVSAVFNLEINNAFADFFLTMAAADCNAPTGTLVTVLVPGSATHAPYSAQRLFDVEPGTHTFHLNAAMFNTGMLNLLRANLRAVFVP